jgi:hypothetical protein
MLRVAFTNRRGLDRGNAQPDTIRADFARFDLDIWSAALIRDKRTDVRRTRLQQLMTWRNAVAHHDFLFTAQQQALLANTGLTLPWARQWRRSCGALAATFDHAVADHIEIVAGTRPW